MEKIVYYCPHCGDVYKNINKNPSFTCDFCKTPLLSTNMTNQEILKIFDSKNTSLEDIIFDNFIKAQNTFNIKAYNKRKNFVSHVDMSVLGRQDDYSNVSNNTNSKLQNNNRPTTNSQGQIICAKCGSNQIHSDRRGWKLSTGLLGSSQIWITCLSCGYKWKAGKK